jgi:O-antigen/teichoic acid export membrane protein
MIGAGPDRIGVAAASGLRARLVRALGLRAALMAVSFSSAILLTRMLGPQEYGVYVFAMAVMTVFALPGQAGPPTFMVRKLAFLGVDNDWGRVLGLVSRVRWLILGYSLVAAIGLYLVAQLAFGGGLDDARGRALLWSAMLLPGVILVTVTGASLRGLDHLALGQTVETLLRPAGFLVVVALVLVCAVNLDAGRAIALHGLAAWIAALAALALHRHALTPARGIAPRRYGNAEVLRDLAPFTLVAGVQLVIAQTDVVMIGVMRPSEEAGHYQVALQWANLVLIAQQAVLMVAGPTIARAYRRGDLADVQATLTYSARLVFATALPIAAVLLLFGPQIIAATFGTAYAPAFAALWVLALGQLVYASFGAIVALAKMVGMERRLLGLVSVAALINLGLNLVLIPAHGIFGAAVAGIIADFSWKSILVVSIWRKLGLASFPVGAGHAAALRASTIPGGG